MLIKICGITDVSEAEILNKYEVDFAGMVLFFPKSKRNITLSRAREIISVLGENIKKVAVVVSPTVEQIEEIQKAPFDYVQIHGEMTEQVLDVITLPVLKAFNVSDMGRYKEYHDNDKIKGYVFDAVEAGSGKCFDWSLVNDIPRDEKLFILAGGLKPENVSEAIKYVKPDGVDVSSGVENENGKGKNEDKIRKFVNAVKDYA